METFSPGDRVVAINTDISAPLHPNGDRSRYPFQFPDGPLRRDVIYHVASVTGRPGENQGIFLTGMNIRWGPNAIAWDSSRFRKVDVLHEHSPRHRRKKQPTAMPTV